MDFQTSVKTCLTQKYAGFAGRASRSEYWWFALAYIIGAVILSLIGLWVLQLIYVLALIVPIAAAGFRRLQDTGRPGWYIFIPVGLSLLSYVLMPAPTVVEPGQVPEMTGMGGMGLLALLGIVQLVVAILFIWWLTRPSQPETNNYGPPPAA